MMFSIDLLKGKGLPEKVDLKRSALKALPILIPVLAVTLFASAYHKDSVSLKNQKQLLHSNQQQLEHHTKDVAEYNKMKAAIKDVENCLSDISKAMAYRIQVSDILVELVQTLPDNIFIYEMNLDRNASQEKFQAAESSEVKQKLVVRRNLNLVLCGFNADQSDAAVQAYINDLKQSSVLAEIFTQITPPTRQQGQVDGRPAIYYEIECELREQSK
ncbi:MAG: hypothetical protein ACYSOF_05200 [Planctomycetota bacterium]|jgi:Tfp pilus assembly protein PilN